MIRNNLAVLLAQKEVKISRMALDTGLSRTTLTSLSQNESKRIDNETLNTILMYLQISPNQFFNFVPYDFNINIEVNNFKITQVIPESHIAFYTLEAGDFDLFIKLDDKISERTPTYEFEIKIDGQFNKIKIEEISVQTDFNVWEEDTLSEGKFVFNLLGDKDTTDKFKKFIDNKITIEFQKEIQSRIEQEFANVMKEQLKIHLENSESDIYYISSSLIEIVSVDYMLNFLPF